MLYRLATFQYQTEVVSGYVEEVYRDVFDGDLRITVNGRIFRFKEPSLIRVRENEIVFIYGDIGKKEITDEQLFDEMRKEQFRESVDSTVSRLDPKMVHRMRFSLGKKKMSRKRLFMNGLKNNTPASVGDK